MPQHCQLGPLLSYGSEGSVYSGMWRGKTAAIKVLTNQYARRVEVEAKLVMNLNHTHIIKYFDLESERGTAYLSMEYITGGNLFEFIRARFNSDSYWTTISQILSDVAQGMRYLHDHRIIQGDLKSHNILLRDDTQQAVICDFGISKLLDQENDVKKRANTAKGTIRWMAPEICTPPPEASSYESDVWSFGCMVLETTSGREPWIDQYPEDILLFRALQRKENASVFTRICSNQAGPSHIRELLLRCCAWSKSDRPRFTHILNDFRPQDDGETFSDARADCMSVDSPTSDDQPVSENEYEEPSGNYQERLQTPTNRSFDTPDRVFHRRTTVPEPTRPQARLTGEVFTSKGTASGRPIYEGVKGGRYYLTPSGSKVYLHK